jgi:hypothetical protein
MVSKHLSTLELDKYATLDEIKSQYRMLSKKYHPDIVGTGDNLKFIEIGVAYAWLIKNHIPKIKTDDNTYILIRTTTFKDGYRPDLYQIFVAMPTRKIINSTIVEIDESFRIAGSGKSIHKTLRVELKEGTTFPDTTLLTQDGKDYVITFNYRIF